MMTILVSHYGRRPGGPCYAGPIACGLVQLLVSSWESRLPERHEQEQVFGLWLQAYPVPDIANAGGVDTETALKSHGKDDCISKHLVALRL